LDSTRKTAQAVTRTGRACPEISKGITMKKIVYAAFASVAALALAACGSSDKASEDAQAENVEMPAEEAMNAAEATATPAVDASAAATGEASAAATETAAPKM
jgi:hypothetical protein